MGISGSDVAKEASDMILADDHFSTIEVAIEEGRAIFNNIKKAVLFLLASNFAEIIVMVIALLLGLPSPLLAIHILIVNLITDSMPALALGADKKEEDIMMKVPRDKKSALFSKHGFANTAIYALIIAMATLFAFCIPALEQICFMGGSLTFDKVKFLYNDGALLEKARTYAFVTLSLSELAYAFRVKVGKSTIFSNKAYNNLFLDLAFIGGICFVFLLTNLPIANEVLNLCSEGIMRLGAILLISLIPALIKG